MHISTNKRFRQKNMPKDILNGEPFLKSICLLRFIDMDIEKVYRFE